jgi:hypothetical protein
VGLRVARRQSNPAAGIDRLITDEGAAVGGASDSDIERSAVIEQDRRVQHTVDPRNQIRAAVGLGFPDISRAAEPWAKLSW